MNQTNGSLVADTDYTWTAADGKLVFKDTAIINQTADGNTSIISYQYCGDKYVGGSVNRTLLNLIPIFLALAIALIALWPTLQSKILGGD